MTTDRINITFHRANNKPRVSLIALTLVAAAFAVAPATSLAGGGSDEYIPSKGESGGGGGGGGNGGDFAVPGLDDQAAPADPAAPVEEVPVEPVGPTPEEIAAQEAAEKKARKKEKRQEAKREAKRQAKKEAKQAEKAAAEAAAAADALETTTGTQTAADVARTAFEDQGAGPLPLVLGILLLVTGVGLVIRYRRTGRGSA